MRLKGGGGSGAMRSSQGAGEDAGLFQGQRGCNRGKVVVECRHHQLGMEMAINSGTTWVVEGFLGVCP